MIDGQPCLSVMRNVSRQDSHRRVNKDSDIVLSWSLYDGGLMCLVGANESEHEQAS
jgi:hypothetical protein